MSRTRMDIASVVVGGGPVSSMLVLKPHDHQPGLGEVQLPIRIGVAEASSISAVLSHMPLARPLTHDLLAKTVAALGARVRDVTITRVEGTTFYATVALVTGDDEVVEVDARPSDAIALALRSDAPVYAEQDVLVSAACPDFGAIRESAQAEQLADFHAFVEGLSPQDFS